MLMAHATMPSVPCRHRLRRTPHRPCFGIGSPTDHCVVSRSARDRLADIQTAIAKVYAYRPALRGEHSEMAVSAILREIGIIGEAVNALPDTVTAKQREIAWRQIGAMRSLSMSTPSVSTSTSTKARSTMSSRTISRLQEPSMTTARSSSWSSTEQVGATHHRLACSTYAASPARASALS